VEHVKSAELDCGFFEMDFNMSEPSLYNMLPLSDEEYESVIGERVYKIGGSTGLTVGRLQVMPANCRCPTSQEWYRACIEVKWDDDCPFAFHGDCGALYCLKRRDAFVPIGIHRVSGINCSYGSSFGDAMERLPFDNIVFPNPLFWRHSVGQMAHEEKKMQGMKSKT